FAGNAQNHDVAVDLAEIVDQRLAGATQQVVKRGDIGNRCGQGVAGQQHVSSFVTAAGYRGRRTSAPGRARARTTPRPAMSGAPRPSPSPACRAKTAPGS